MGGGSGRARERGGEREMPNVNVTDLSRGLSVEVETEMGEGECV
jgi:hypothetical protein